MSSHSNTAHDSDEINNPHDLMFKATLSDIDLANDVLRTHIPPNFLELFTSDPSTPLEGTFIDANLRSQQVDKLFRMKLRSGNFAFVYVLLEHKSYSDPATALQIARYKIRIWQAYARNRPNRYRALPGIIPIIFYHGPDPWSAPLSLAAMVVDPPFRLLEPTFGYYLRNLRTIPFQLLATHPADRAGLAALRYSHSGPDAMEEKLRVLPEMLAGLPDHSELEQQIMLYVIEIWAVSVATLRRAAETAKPGKGTRLVGEVLQQLVDQGKAEGLIAGKAQGMATTLIQLLEHRFGPIPQGTRHRIERSTPDELNARFSAALKAGALPDVFGDIGTE